MQKPHPPFTCTYSPNIPELLWQLNCTLAISTYQAGKVVLISPRNEEELVQLPRNFPKPMGLAVDGNRMAIATLNEVVVLANEPSLARGYPDQPNTYDSLYLPRAVYYSGEVDLHDMDWGKKGLWGVNTRFSCLSLIDDRYSFNPQWQPPFISSLAAEDRCHLNGMALVNGEPEFVTALGKTDSAEGWRKNKQNGGIIMHVPTGEIICENLGMPHTPRVYDGKLYVLLSSTGELICVSPQDGKYEVVKKLPGFVRGMDKLDDYLFIGLSKLRTTSSAFRDLPIAKQSVFSGIIVVYLPRTSVVGHIRYETSVEELFDVRVLPNLKRPGLLSTQKEVHRLALATPTDSFWGRKEKEGGEVTPDPASE